MSYFAEKDASGQVMRVIVADSLAWIQSRLGGTWVETKAKDATEAYAGPGLYHSLIPPTRFVPQWVQPTGAQDAYAVGQWVWHGGQVWENLTPANVWQPGVTGWRDPLNEWPQWIQPMGGHDAYPLGAKVTFESKRYVSKINANVWSPTAYPAGWTVQP